MYSISLAAIPDFLPPQNVDAEESILGGLMFDPEAYDRIKDDLFPQAFYCQAHQEIYKAIVKLKAAGRPSDLMSVASYLADTKKLEKAGGTSKLAQLVDRTCSAVNIDAHAALVNDKWMRRRLISLTDSIKDRALATEQNLSLVLEEIEDLVLKETRSKFRTDFSKTLSQQKCEKLINEIRAIELEVDRPDYREFLLMELAEKHGIRGGTKVLKNLYHKSLIAEEDEPFMTIDEADQKYGSEVNQWLLHGLLPKGKTILMHADSYVGKTSLAYDLIYHLVTGAHWQEFSNTGTRRCLLVQADESGSDMLRKFFERGISSGLPIKLKTKWSIDHMQRLRKEIIENQAEFVVIDSLTGVNRHSLISENDSEYARPLLVLRDIAQETGCTIMILHHNNKDGNYRGSSAIKASVSEVLHLTKVPNDPDPNSTKRLLLFEKARSRCPGAYSLELNPQNHSWFCEPISNDDIEPNTMKTKQAIISYLRKHPNVKYETAEICNLVPGQAPHIRKALSALANEGIISRERKTHGSSSFLYYIAQSSDHGSEGSESVIRTETIDIKAIDLNSDHDQKKIAQNDLKKKSAKNVKSTIRDQSLSKTETTGDSSPDLTSDHDSDRYNFFGDLSNSGSVNLVNGSAGSNHLKVNDNKGYILPEDYLSEYKSSDHVIYTGDQSIYQGKTYKVIRVCPDTWCSFSYICQDLSDHRGNSVRLKEEDLSLAPQKIESARSDFNHKDDA